MSLASVRAVERHLQTPLANRTTTASRNVSEHQFPLLTTSFSLASVELQQYGQTLDFVLILFKQRKNPIS